MIICKTWVDASAPFVFVAGCAYYIISTMAPPIGGSVFVVPGR